MPQESELLNVIYDSCDPPLSAELEEAIRKTRRNVKRAIRAEHGRAITASLKKVQDDRIAVPA